MYNKEKTMDNKFYIYVKTLTYLGKWGPGGGGGGGFNNQTGPILVHIYPHCPVADPGFEVTGPTFLGFRIAPPPLERFS